MITMPDLQTALLDLLHEVKGTDIKLIIGGGFGTYLKTNYVRRMGVRTLLIEWPEPRSTNEKMGTVLFFPFFLRSANWPDHFFYFIILPEVADKHPATVYCPAIHLTPQRILCA